VSDSRDTSLATVTVLGLGYAGLPVAAAAATARHQVWGLDTDPGRVALVNSGVSPVETVTRQELLNARSRLTATTDPQCLTSSTIVLLCVPTPLDDSGAPDLEPLTTAAHTVRDHLRPGQLIIQESTSYPGTTDGLLRSILEEIGLRAGTDFALACSPERIDPGSTTHRLSSTPRVVGGLTRACRDRAAAFYTPLAGGIHLASGLREAEAAKILENTYRQVNIALVNEFAQICHHMGVDVWDTLAAAATKPFGYVPFRPGAGPGGHCIPADPMILVHRAGQMGLRFLLAETAQHVNQNMPLWIADRACKHLEHTMGTPVDQARILLLGVTYKANVADTRGTPAVPLAQQLLSRGATITFHDPHVAELDVGYVRIPCVPDLALALDRAQLCILLQRHDAYEDQVLARAHVLFDTTGLANHPRKITL
jgi:nucleotide sugar dehydrogenase